jgi:hypothetical protein
MTHLQAPFSPGNHFFDPGDKKLLGSGFRRHLGRFLSGAWKRAGDRSVSSHTPWFAEPDLMATIGASGKTGCHPGILQAG